MARYANLVQGTAARVLHDPEEAKDVAQAVFADFLRLAPAPAREETEAVFGGWLHRHTVFLALRRRTASRRRALRETEAQRRWSLNAPERNGPPEWLEEMDAALNELSEADRLALIARYLEDQPLRALAQSFHVSEDAAQKRVSRALDHLRARLERRGIAGVSAASLVAAVSLPAPPVHAAALAAAAWQASAVSTTSTAGASWTVFSLMNLKAALTGAGAAALLTAAGLTPVLLHQRAVIAELEQKLQTTASDPSAAARSRAGKSGLPVASSRPATGAGKEREQFRALQERQTAVRSRVQAWQEAVMQIDDAERKQSALEEMLAALRSEQTGDVFAALTAYQTVGSVEFDRTPFREALTGLLTHSDPEIRAGAVGMIPGLPEDGGDIELVTALAGDADERVRSAVLNSLFWLSKGDLTAGAGETVLGILNRSEQPTRSLINVMWGARFAPQLEETLVEFARRTPHPDDGELPYYAVYSCLSTQQNKGPACVELLIERLSDKDSLNVGGRAAWGLGYGVRQGLGLETKIADAAIKVWPNRTDGYLREQLLKCIQNYGHSGHAAVLDEIATSPAMGETQRKALAELSNELRARPQPR